MESLYRSLFIFLMIFYSCSNQKHFRDILGEYRSDENGYIHNLYLYEDNSFVFIIREGLTTDTLTGKWDILSNEIIFIGVENKSNLKKLYIKEQINTILDIYDEKGEKLIGALISFYKDTNLIEIETYTNDNKVFSIIDTDSIYIEMLGYSNIGFKIDDVHNMYKVKMARNIDNYIFKNNKFYLKNGNISISNDIIMLKRKNKHRWYSPDTLIKNE
jgi:hypothetical protein